MLSTQRNQWLPSASPALCITPLLQLILSPCLQILFPPGSLIFMSKQAGAALLEEGFGEPHHCWAITRGCALRIAVVVWTLCRCCVIPVSQRRRHSIWSQSLGIHFFLLCLVNQPKGCWCFFSAKICILLFSFTLGRKIYNELQNSTDKNRDFGDKSIEASFSAAGVDILKELWQRDKNWLLQWDSGCARDLSVRKTSMLDCVYYVEVPKTQVRYSVSRIDSNHMIQSLLQANGVANC